MNKKALENLPSVEAKITITSKTGTSYTWESRAIEGIGSLETHRDYLVAALAGDLYKELKIAIFHKGLSSVKVDINNTRYSSRRYINAYNKLVMDLYNEICKEIKRWDNNA